MKFTLENPCGCGGRFVFSAFGDGEFAPTTCTDYGKPGYLFDPLSVSVTAERLLFRSKAELQGGDYSLSTVIAVMAVESYLTRLFLKFKGMASYAVTFNLPTSAEEAAWEKEYPRSGGFSGPIDFVSQHLAGMSFDKFVAGNPTASAIFPALPNPSNDSADPIFSKRTFQATKPDRALGLRELKEIRCGTVPYHCCRFGFHLARDGSLKIRNSLT